MKNGDGGKCGNTSEFDLASCCHFVAVDAQEKHTCVHRHFTEAWRCKGCATIPASSQLPKIHPTQHPLICIINALIVPRGHRRVSVKRVAFQFANGSALSRNESNRYARWYGWRVMAQQAFVNWTPRIKIHDGSLARVTVFPRKSIGVIDFFRIAIRDVESDPAHN